MANTVISIFEQVEQASEASSYLLAHGFAQTQVNLKTASYKGEDSGDNETSQETGLMDHITSFFKDLFGADHDEVSKYAAAGRNRTIVTVHTDTSEQAEQAAVILDHHGAINVNETAGSYFPESAEILSQQQFSDNPEVIDPPKQLSDKDAEYRQRASVIKSRIIDRSVDKTPDGF